MIFIDGEPWPPRLHGTGTEDYFNTAFCPKQEYSAPYHGITVYSGNEAWPWGGKNSMYRFHIEDPIRFERSDLGPKAVDRFIELHQARWGDEGLFPRTEGGDRSRLFLHRLAELEAQEGDRAQLQIGAVSVGDRVIFATVGFDDGETCYFYNAGMDPDARDLSPGVTGTAAYVRDRLEAGRRHFDFLRGAETYKYEWGAKDQPIYRVLVQRTFPA